MPTTDRKKFNTRSKRQFSRWAAIYDGLLFRIYFEPLYKAVIESVQSNVGSELAKSIRVLDVACGTAEVISRLSELFPKSHFTGIDFSTEMIKEAKQKTQNRKNIAISEGNVENLSFSNDTFDFIVCSESFHHFFEPQDALKEMARVLKLKGRLLLVDFNSRSVFIRIFGNIFKRIEHARKYYSQEEMHQLLELSGFSVRDIFTRHWNNFFICVKI